MTHDLLLNIAAIRGFLVRGGDGGVWPLVRWFEGLTATCSEMESSTSSNLKVVRVKVGAVPHRVFDVVKNDEMQKWEGHERKREIMHTGAEK